jgi:hypothetical protein
MLRLSIYKHMPNYLLFFRRPLLGSIFFYVFCCSVTFAQTLTFTGGITTLKFGTLQKPSSGSQTYIISATGAVSGTGTKLYGVTGNAQVQLKRTGTPARTISIDIQNVNTGDANLTLTNFTGRYKTTNIASFPVGAMADPGTTSATLKIGATATYNSSVPIGSLTPSFDIVAIFE